MSDCVTCQMAARRSKLFWAIFMALLYVTSAGDAASVGSTKDMPEEEGVVKRLSAITTVTVTNRMCDLNALSRISDESYCDKYYVCSSGLYVGLSCPCGMAFDYGLQECRLRKDVECSQRPYFNDGTADDCSGSSSSSTEKATQPKPARVPQQHVTVVKPAIVAGLGQPDVLVLPLGAKVMIPFGTTILLPPGSKIQQQQQQNNESPAPLLVPPTVTSHHHDQQTISPSSQNSTTESTTPILDEDSMEAVTADYEDDDFTPTTKFDPLKF